MLKSVRGCKNIHGNKIERVIHGKSERVITRQFFFVGNMIVSGSFGSKMLMSHLAHHGNLNFDQTIPFPPFSIIILVKRNSKWSLLPFWLPSSS